MDIRWISRVVRTFVEATTDSGDNNLNSEQCAEAYEHSTALLIDCVHTDNVYGWAKFPD